MKNYCIKEGYTIRADAAAFDDRPFKDEYQDDVYTWARYIAERMGAKVIMDVGCGSGYKLVKHFADYQTVGYELEPALSYLRATYPERMWMDAGKTVCPSPMYPRLMICSDVIEHVLDPDQLLDYIVQLAPDCLVLSTPDRVRLALGTEDGPPKNVHHVREWTGEELREYLSAKFKVVEWKDGATTIIQATIRRYPC